MLNGLFGDQERELAQIRKEKELLNKEKRVCLL